MKRKFDEPVIIDAYGEELVRDYRRTFSACNNCTDYIVVVRKDDIANMLKAQKE